MAPLAADWSYAEWNATYNAFSFGIAAMGSATIFFWLQLANVSKSYRTALIIAGIVTCITTYRNFGYYNSWVEAFKVVANDGGDYTVTLTGTPFFDEYRDRGDWMLTLPLLLIELILVMKLPHEETVSLCWKLGVASVLMVALGHQLEIQDDLPVLWIWWFLAMIPFCYIVRTLVVGLNEATSKQPTPAAASLVSAARYVTVVSWLAYPFVGLAWQAMAYVGLAGPTATMYQQIGYILVDVWAKAFFGVLIWAIASEKSAVEESGRLLPH
jgi:bacteriorhodopsin